MIRSAIVPVAGLGTRLLPATKSQPKEMLPVARKPVVQYVVEELAANGIREILFVTGRNKSAIENHFDSDPALIQALNAACKHDLLRELEFERLGVHIFYTRQSEQKGLGDAILCGENFAGEQPFVVALGDSIIGLNAKSDCVARMVNFFEERKASCVVAVEEVPAEETHRYGIVQGVPEVDGFLRVSDVIEKPPPEQAPSRWAIAGRYVFSPLIFDMIRKVTPDAHGEIQLTDAIRLLCDEGRRVYACMLGKHERRYDIGNFPSYFEAFVEFALADPDYGPRLRQSLKRLLACE